MAACRECKNLGWVGWTYGSYPNDCQLDFCFVEKTRTDTLYGKTWVEKVRVKSCEELNKNLDCSYFEPYPPSETFKEVIAGIRQQIIQAIKTIWKTKTG